MTRTPILFLSILGLGLCLALVLAFGGSSLAQDAEKTYKISINQYVEHPSLNESVKGFKDQLKESGLKVEYYEHNAQAQMATLSQIVNQIVDEKPDLILAVATNSAQVTVQKIKDTPVLFTAVTDPVTANLVSTLENPGANVTGTTDINPVALQLALIKEVQPNAVNIGIIYNAGETNSVVQVDLAKEVADSLKVKLVEATTPNTAGVNAAAQSLVGKVDAIYLPTDNAVIASLESVLKVSLDHKIPIYPAESDSIKKGGAAVLSISYYELGRQTGKMAVKILKDGVPPKDVPVEAQSDHKLIVNKAYADKIGLSIPKSVLDKADEIIEK
jgi:putative ABC transport system substrate-binding protein